MRGTAADSRQQYSSIGEVPFRETEAGQFKRRRRSREKDKRDTECTGNSKQRSLNYVSLHQAYISGTARTHTTRGTMAGTRGSFVAAGSVAALLIAGSSSFVIPTPQVCVRRQGAHVCVWAALITCIHPHIIMTYTQTPTHKHMVHSDSKHGAFCSLVTFKN